MARRFLILHGYEGSEPDHWQTWLAGRLRERGQHVRYPDLPEPFAPEPRAWGEALHAELADLAGPLGGQGERVVVCHSLASTLWLREAAAVAPEHRVDRVVLVAPPCPDGAPAVLSPFFPVDTAPEALAAAAGSTRVVCADDDPFCPDGAAGRWGAPLGLPVDLVTGGGHLNPDAGFGPWAAMEAWCLGKRPAVAGYPDAEPARRDQ